MVKNRDIEKRRTEKSKTSLVKRPVKTRDFLLTVVLFKMGFSLNLSPI